MAARNGNDWSVFGRASDPVPGDATQISAIAQMLTDRETAAHEVAVGINGLCTDPALHAWLGASGDAFRNTLEPLPGLLRSMVDAFNAASAAMAQYAGALTASQNTADSNYRQRMTELNAATAKNGGTRPHLRVGSTGFVDAPQGIDDGDWYTQQLNVDTDAVPQHDQARAALVRALDDANGTLRRVLSTLGNPVFNDFDAQFVKNGGQLSDLTPATFENLGDGVAAADAADLSSLMNGDESGLDPNAVREELSQLPFRYQNDPEFWQKFAPSLGNVVDWLQAHPGNGDEPDQALIQDLGNRVSGAASSGALTASMVAGLSTVGLIGLSKVLGAGSGAYYGNGPGAQFLADMSRLYINKEAAFDPNDPEHKADFGAALSTVLNTTAQNDAAARDLFSAPDGVDLATKLLQGSTQVTAEIGARGGPYPAHYEVFQNLDPNAVAALFAAARQPVDPSAHDRGTSAADQQRMQAAYNIIVAGAAYSGWHPANPPLGEVKSAQLPPQLTGALEDYAKAYGYDLGVSATGTNDNGSDPVGLAHIGGDPNAPLGFLVSHQQLHQFLTVALNDPHTAADYVGWTKAQYQASVQLSIMTHKDYTLGTSNLVGIAQGTLDDMHLTGAAAQDAAAAQRAAFVNGVLGGLGNAPLPGVTAGVGQAVGGFLTPYIDQLPPFDTTHEAQAKVLNSLSDAQVSGSAVALVVQAAVDSGQLHLPPGILVDGRIKDYGELKEWWSAGGDKWYSPSGSPNDTLYSYAKLVSGAIHDNSVY